MRLSGYVLEFADGTQIQVGASPHTNAPVVLKSDVPNGRLIAFTDNNPPKGTCHASLNQSDVRYEPLLTA